MLSVCVLLANGFEEIEAITVIDVLRRADIAVSVVGVEGPEVVGAHGIRVRADLTLAQAMAKTWSVVVLPGGLPGAHTLRDHKLVQDLIKRQHASGQKLAAICAAPIALASAGILSGKNVTCYPGFENELGGAVYKNDRVVKDGNILTSQGPGTAMEFALALVEELRGKKLTDSVRTGLILK